MLYMPLNQCFCIRAKLQTGIDNSCCCSQIIASISVVLGTAPPEATATASSQTSPLALHIHSACIPSPIRSVASISTDHCRRVRAGLVSITASRSLQNLSAGHNRLAPTLARKARRCSSSRCINSNGGRSAGAGSIFCNPWRRACSTKRANTSSCSVTASASPSLRMRLSPSAKSVPVPIASSSKFEGFQQLLRAVSKDFRDPGNRWHNRHKLARCEWTVLAVAE